MTAEASGGGATYQLTVQSGAMPGATWIVGSTPLLIGRSQTCHIVLTDDLVSRTHCSVQRIGDGVRLRDLGSSNACLLNGKPVTDAALNSGDRVTVGDTIFLVSVVQTEPRLELATPGKNETLRLDAGEIALLRAANEPAELSRLPKSAREYATLFQFSLDCAGCPDSDTLRDRLTAWLREHFGAAAIWLHERHAEGLAWVLREPKDAIEPARHLLESVTEDRRARLLQAGADRAGQSASGESMICPLFVSGDVVGLLTVIAPESGRAYQRDDLELLMSMGHVLSPYLRAVAEREALRLSNARLRAQGHERSQLVGKSDALHTVRKHLQQAAMTEELPVLLLGETGTGKELAARQIHLRSSRGERDMVVVNCAAIPDDLFESELFGHVRGAFTGASSANPGLAALAHGSTLFLDEVAELSPANQAKLLRFVELGHYRPVGDSRERTADVRVMAATNSPLPCDGFRADLYHRLSGFVIHLPALRARPDDIAPLAEHFRLEYAVADGPGREGFTREAAEAMRAHAWPGNVRELRLRVHRALRVAQGAKLTPHDVFIDTVPEEHAAVYEPLATLAERERQHITRVLEHCGGDTLRAAQVLGIARSTIYKKISEYGLR